MSTDDTASLTVAEHLTEACRLMDGPDVDPESWDECRRDNVGTAQVHATIALALLALSSRTTIAVADLPVPLGNPRSQP